MYEQFFGLRTNPFNLSPDPRFLVLTHELNETLAMMAYGVLYRKGFVLLTGEVGTGKTTLLQRLLQITADAEIATSFVFHSRLDETGFLEYMLADFGLNCDLSRKGQMLVQLNRWLIDLHRQNRTAALIIDEAQNCSAEVLEQVRLLSNLETPTQKLLQIVLCGQPELEQNLSNPAMRQLRQRITIRCKIHHLDLQETRNYIASRLGMAGANRPLFTDTAVEAVHYFCRGIPRLINVVCEHALINCFADQKQIVDGDVIERIAPEFELDGEEQPPAIALPRVQIPSNTERLR